MVKETRLLHCYKYMAETDETLWEMDDFIKILVQQNKDITREELLEKEGISQYLKSLHEIVVNLGAHSYNSGRNYAIDVITKDACELINRAKLTSEPVHWSGYLRNSILKGNPYLFDDVQELALFCYEKEDKGTFNMAIYSRHLTNDDENYKLGFPTLVLFSEEDIDNLNRVPGGEKTDNIGNKAIRFLVKYWTLMGMEKKPIEVSRIAAGEGKAKGKKYRGKNIKYKTISLTREYVSSHKNRDCTGCLEREGKHKKQVKVSGYIRLQHYGEGNSQSHLIWVDAYEQGKWVNDGITIRRIIR